MDSQSHPLLLELNSLKSTVARFQDEAHASAVKLQRHSLDRANTHERAVVLERENDLLKTEIAILRANPIASSSTSTAEQVQQLTLSLRRLSEKLTLTEEALSNKTTELIQANAELVKSRLTAESAYEVGARVRGREEAAKIREHELAWRLKSAEEEKKISEIAVGEYANLVRSMEARMGLGSISTSVSPNGSRTDEDPAKPSSDDALGITLSSSLIEGKLGLKRLLSEFQSEMEEQQRQINQLRRELEVVNSNHAAERKGTHILHQELAQAQSELQMLRIDDNTAARMVSRYMQFSQTSTNTLQSTLSVLKTRHAATISTLTSTSYSLTSNLSSAENTIERLRTSLDELGGEMMKETYGRRREVALRVKLLGREEKMLEALRRWIRKGEEAISEAEFAGRDNQIRVREALLGMAQDARILLEGLDDGVVTDSVSLSGSLARVVLAQGLADGLVQELKLETARRMDLERAVVQEEQDINSPTATLNVSTANQQQTVSEEQESSSYSSSSSATIPPPEVITVRLPESERKLFKGAQSTTAAVLIDATLVDTNTPDKPSPITKDDLIRPESTLLVDEMVIVANEQNLPPFHTHQSDHLTPNSPSTTILPENTAETESFLVGAQLTLSSSTPVPDIVVDADVSSSPHICTNPVLEEAGVDQLLVIEQVDVTPQDVDMSVEPSSIPAVVGPRPGVELVIDDTMSSTSLPSPLNLKSVIDPSAPLKPATSPPTTPPAGQPPILTEKETPPPHPLLTELAKTRNRYDDLQRSFRDCHLALEGLKESLGPSSSMDHSFKPSSTYTNRANGDKPPELILTPRIPMDILSAAVSRLDDYTEDARVEVEIRISDEEMLAKGYEVLLCIPGALYSSSTPTSSLLHQYRQSRQSQHESQSTYPSQSHTNLDQDQNFGLEELSCVPSTQCELEIQIQAFITGTDPSVTKAREGFSKKLEDVQHDIAVLKRAIHDPDPEMLVMMSEGPELPSQTPTTPETSGRGWASWIRSPSGRPAPFSASSSAATAFTKQGFGGLGSSPTFGSIMTSPHRLKHSPSLNTNAYGNQKSGSTRKASFVEGNGSIWSQGGGREGRDDILGRLGLKVPMPIFDSAVYQPPLSSSSSSVATGGWGWNGLSPTTPTQIKQRSVSSTMYMLGLGAPPIMSATRSRGTSSSSTSSQKVDDPAGGVVAPVASDNDVQGSDDVGQDNKLSSVGGDEYDEIMDTETEDEQQYEQDTDVE